MDMIFPTHTLLLSRQNPWPSHCEHSIRFLTVWLILHASLEFAFLTSPSSSSANKGTSTLAGNLIFSSGLRPFWLEPAKTPCPVSPTHVEKKDKRAIKCSNLILYSNTKTAHSHIAVCPGSLLDFYSNSVLERIELWRWYHQALTLHMCYHGRLKHHKIGKWKGGHCLLFTILIESQYRWMWYDRYSILISFTWSNKECLKIGSSASLIG